MPINFFDDLEARGLVHTATEGVRKHLAEGPVTAYIGFDPTASSLHVGSLLPILALARLQRAGHRPLALVGGGTGMIGDPSGKTSERQILTRQQVEANVEGIRKQLARFLDFSGPNAAMLIDNYEWLGGLRLVDFLRDVGKHFTVNYMLAKESVSRRIEQEEGISYTEFAYMLLQAFDFRELADQKGVSLQMGGSDQWGNITAGLELIRRTRNRHAHGIVMPLVTTSTGVKFGKTEAGTIWLDPDLTSPFRFYQFWLNAEDQDVERYLNFFTFLSQEEIAHVVAAHNQNPATRAGQRRLAAEVTRIVHGEEGLTSAERGTQAIYRKSNHHDTKDVIDEEELLHALGDVPSTYVQLGLLQGAGLSIVDMLVKSGLATSKAEARRLITGGGIYLDNERVTDPDYRIRIAGLVGRRLLLLRKGKKENRVVRLVG